MLCSVTHNSCSVVSLKQRINDVLRTAATGVAKKRVQGRVSALFPVCFRAGGCVRCLKTVCDSVCSLVDCVCRYDEG